MDESKIKVLITGGMGFIGTALVKYFVDISDVTIADCLFFGESPEIKPLVEQNKVEFIRTDLAEISDLHQRVCDGDFDVIVHTASLTHIPLCEKYPDYAYRENVISAINLISRIPKNCKFINFSTSSIYAPQMSLHTEDDSSPIPCDFYGWTKKHVEDLASYYASKYNLEILHIRLANAAGYGETNPKLLGAIFQQIKGGKDLVTLGNLTPRRDFIHISDIAWVVDNLIKIWPVNKGKAEVYNVGTGYEPISVEDIFYKIDSCVSRKLKLKSIAEKKRTTDRELLAVDISKLKKILPNYSPKKIEDWLCDLVKDPGIRISNNMERIIGDYYAKK